MLSLISSLKKIQSPTIIIEFIDQKSMVYYKSLGISETILHHLEENIALKKNEEKSMTFYGDFFGAKKLIVFFPKKDTLFDDRADALRNAPKKSLYMPSCDFLEAFEILSLSTYSYDVFLSKKDEKLYEFYIAETERKYIESSIPLLTAINRARDIINLPPTDTRPEAFVSYIQSFPWKRFTLRVIDAASLRKLGCNLLLAVGAWSDYPPYMVILERITDKKLDTYALIGKGVTFDAWGLQIKPDTGMLDMKCDMSWAAWMLGVAEYLDGLEDIPCNLIIGLGITENVINGKAFKPLDIYKAYNGTTVEIHHTDAEGRLVLADVMSYIGAQYDPEHMITMATLTGACVYALGHDIAGIMGDDEQVINALLTSDSPYEKVWRLPLNEKLKKSLKAEIADLKNVARSEKAGSSVGWAFLTYFQGKSKLTHLDIAGPAYRETTWGYMPKWGTGWWVKILSEFILTLKKK
jgi:leucyl aminopeptidase